MKGYFIAAAALAFLASCAPTRVQDMLEGNWVTPVPGQPGKMQGIQLGGGGSASSINMATLVYEHWQREGDKIVVSGRSIGNGRTLPFTETLTIKENTSSRLTLMNQNGVEFRYSKMK